MTFKEIRERLANRDAIRERQVIEERAEEEREMLKERARRAEERAAAKLEQQQLQQQQLQQQQQAVAVTASNDTTTAAADTSSEVAKKIKEKFKKDTSRVIVKVLDPYRKPDVSHGRIKNNEDFKHLAKKVSLNNSLLSLHTQRLFLSFAVD